MDSLVLIGRSSSHFTRVARIFAAELRVEHRFQVVRDLMVADASTYGENPALRVPILKAPEAAWFGALNICRELARRAELERRVVWPEALVQPLPANAQELVLQAMATEVTLIMSRRAGIPDDNEYSAKLLASLGNSLRWLEQHAAQALVTLPPERELSFLEVTLFCLVTHLDFRDILPLAGYPGLNQLCSDFARRPSAEATGYRFDA